MNDPSHTRGVLAGARVVVGVTGSIAAYKSAALVSALVQHGARVDVILTAAGARFVTAATFAALTPGEVHTGMFAPRGIPHVALAKNADLLVVAPATARTLARLAHGTADDLLALTALGTRAPVLVAPAMEAEMWTHPATRRNVAQLQADGVAVAGPVSGRHASGDGGAGRMLEPDALIGHIRRLLGAGGDLAGTRCLVTAGGTREPLDPVRVLGNRSSGKMGAALARAARDRGAVVTLVTTAEPPVDDAGFAIRRVATAAEMHATVMANLADHDLLLMAAAVADYRPAAPPERKIKKSAGGRRLTLDLERTDDIVAAAAARRRSAGATSPVIVAFAAETERLQERARDKLSAKGVDLVVGNLVTGVDGSSVFGSDENEVLLVAPEQPTVELPPMAKEQVAHHILDAARLALDSHRRLRRGVERAERPQITPEGSTTPG